MQANKLEISATGDLLLTGKFDDHSFQFGLNGPTLYNSSNNGEGLVAAFSSQNGQCRWARRFGGTGNDQGTAIRANAAGEIYLTGFTGGRNGADLGTFTLPGGPFNYTRRGFLARLSADGTWLAAQQLGSDGELQPGNLMLDASGSVYVSLGVIAPGATLGTTFLNSTINTGWGNSPRSDVAVAKFTAAGNLVWVVQGDPTGNNDGGGGNLVIDNQGHLYVGGAFNSPTLRLGNFTLPNAIIQMSQPNPLPPVPYTTNFYTDAFVARLNANTGAWEWATRQGGAYSDRVTKLLISPSQRLLLNYDSQVGGPGLGSGLVEIDQVTGTWQAVTLWPAAYGTSYYLYDLCFDGQGRVLVAGPFNTASLPLGGQTIPSAGMGLSTGFVARLGTRVLATQSANTTTGTSLQAWPSPGPGMGVRVQGPASAAGQAVEVFDVLGRRVGGGRLPAGGGAARLSWPGAGLAPGLYVVRSGSQSARWVVE